jgi:hypothetical protein
MVDISFYEGMLKIANLLLAFVAGAIAITLFKVSHQKKDLRAWKILIIVLLLFVIQQALGALRAFGIYNSMYLTHVNVSILLGFLIYAISVQINIGLARK